MSNGRPPLSLQQFSIAIHVTAGAYLNHTLGKKLGGEQSQKAVQQVFPAFPEDVAMAMSKGEHGLDAGSHFGISPKKEV